MPVRRDSNKRIALSGRWVRRRVHAVLGDFVDAAGGRLDALAVEMIERDAAFADGIALFDGFGDVGFGERGGFEERTRGSKLRGNRRRKRAAGSVCALRLDAISDELDHFAAVEEHVHGALHVAAFDDHGAGAHFDEFARGCFHVRHIFDCQPG